MRVIFDRSNRFCLPAHARLAPKTDLRPDRIEIGHSLLTQASKLRASNRRQPELFELRDVAARAVADIHDFLRKVRHRNAYYALFRRLQCGTTVIDITDDTGRQRRLRLDHLVPGHRHDVGAAVAGGGQWTTGPGSIN